MRNLRGRVARLERDDGGAGPVGCFWAVVGGEVAYDELSPAEREVLERFLDEVGWPPDGVLDEGPPDLIESMLVELEAAALTIPDDLTDERTSPD